MRQDSHIVPDTITHYLRDGCDDTNDNLTEAKAASSAVVDGESGLIDRCIGSC